ncbi:WD repeat protein [Schizosaccharomyces japonicus yFS275]|uniref:WD repeat protein n=1 Tax=Schizosaccharomyces japonicus (strain yFS275 / FY16936) TaxID=402676 RepID=B6JXH6_SCHJY|nr:WD repeat protein [Schizosaccharomyces japonicus yFS275]EEB05120.1 WD repeat protein [Schizosaccharomyces japonicus yFS275]
MQNVLRYTTNQDRSFLTAALEDGFCVYQLSPLSLQARRRFDDGGVRIAQMIYRSNIILLVGGGKNPKFASNKVIFWDEKKQAPVGEIEFKSEVLNIQCDKQFLLVMLKNKAVLYSITNGPVLLKEIQTSSERGTCSMVSLGQNAIMCIPARNVGHIQLMFFKAKQFKSSIILAHEAAISSLSFSRTGKLLASCSEHGTLIRVWNTETGEKITELRRGFQKAKIKLLRFSPDETLFAASSERSTLHVYSLQGNPIKLLKSSLKVDDEDRLTGSGSTDSFENQMIDSEDAVQQTHWKRRIGEMIDAGKRPHWTIKLASSDPSAMEWLSDTSLFVAYLNGDYQTFTLTVEEHVHKGKSSFQPTLSVHYRAVNNKFGNILSDDE